jgi:predicted transcriptional regulator
LNDKQQVMGVITSRSILNYMTSNKLKKEDEIRRAVNKDFKCVKHSDPMKYLSKSFNRHEHILVHNSDKSEYSVMEHKDYLDYFIKNDQ